MRDLPLTDLAQTPVHESRVFPTDRPDVRDEDLHALLEAFYATVALDPLLAPYFAPVDMREHIPRIADFWSTLLFHSGRYSGNAFRPHSTMPGLTADHFARWLRTLGAVVDERFSGPAAEQMKTLGHRIAFSMQLRLGIPPFAELESAEQEIAEQEITER